MPLQYRSIHKQRSSLPPRDVSSSVCCPPRTATTGGGPPLASRQKEGLYGKESELFVGVQVTHGSTAGERRAPSFPNQSDHHVTRSLLYVWWHLYRERGEAGLRPTQTFDSPPAVDRPQHAHEQMAHLERLCGQQALELDLLRSPGGCANKSLALGLATGSHPSAPRAHRADAGADAFLFGAQALPPVADQPAVV